jgi:gluconolactonase
MHFLTLLLSLLFPVTLPAQETTVPKGEVLKFSFSNSTIFPGTLRDYWIYIPKQYDGKTPACVYVNQDGIQYKAPDVFDKLIAAKEMPVTIGVFVMHGRVKATSDKALDRFNRSFEYDGLGDNYVNFLLKELLPDVETKKASDGRAIVLSKNGNDRAIGGASSGAICAFTAAWERPDAFSRVFSSIGTYVGLRGGNDYPTLVRKYEPKPIRIFLQDGSNDLNIYGGDWWMANQEMQRALKFAGYEVNHVWGTGGHDGKHATEVFPEAMRWLWKDHPTPVGKGKGSPQMQEILIPGEDWKLLKDGYVFTEGPIANKQGEVFFVDVPRSKIFRTSLQNEVTEWTKETQGASGLGFGPDGRLYATGSQMGKVVAYNVSGDATKPVTVADGIKGNDLAVCHDGSIYVTNPAGDSSQLWHINKTGEKKVVDKGLRFANGICLSPDQSLLYVADSRSHWVYSYQIQPDGSLAHKQKYYHLHVPDTADDAWPDGLKTDTAGRLYVTTRIGLQVCDQAGRVNCIIPSPTQSGACSNVCFGGPDMQTLYITCNGKVYWRKVKTKGVHTFEAPVKPNPPRL